MEETIDLREYIDIIKKRFWLIVIITVVASLVSGIVSFYVLEPVYETGTTLMVNNAKNKETEITSEDIALNQKLASTYGEIAKSRKVLDRVINDLNLNITYEKLSSSVTITPVKDTEIINIKVQNTSPQLAYKIANKIPEIFGKEARRITKADSVEVLDYAVIPNNPVAPNKMMNVAIAAVLGMMIGLFLTFLLEYANNKIKTPKDIEKHLELPVLGVIPDTEIKKKNK
jgi:capsular polysaccharide biosynthesis protein